MSDLPSLLAGMHTPRRARPAFCCLKSTKCSLGLPNRLRSAPAGACLFMSVGPPFSEQRKRFAAAKQRSQLRSSPSQSSPTITLAARLDRHKDRMRELAAEAKPVKSVEGDPAGPTSAPPPPRLSYEPRESGTGTGRDVRPDSGTPDAFAVSGLYASSIQPPFTQPRDGGGIDISVGYTPFPDVDGRGAAKLDGPRPLSPVIVGGDAQDDKPLAPPPPPVFSTTVAKDDSVPGPSDKPASSPFSPLSPKVCG